MIPTGKKIITYRFKENEGVTLSINHDKIYYLYATANYSRGGKTLIASGIEQIFIYIKKSNEIPEVSYKFDYYSLVGYVETNRNNNIFCVFDVEEVKINPYMGTMYIYIK